MIKARQELKPVTWAGNSADEIRQLPREAKRELGYQLDQVQRGETPAGSKAMGIGGGIRELCVNSNRSWFRMLYTARDNNVLVLRVFQKKSNQTPKGDIEVAIKRLREAQ